MKNSGNIFYKFQMIGNRNRTLIVHHFDSTTKLVMRVKSSLKEREDKFVAIYTKKKQMKIRTRNFELLKYSSSPRNLYGFLYTTFIQIINGIFNGSDGNVG